jgi:hypothetical protein
MSSCGVRSRAATEVWRDQTWRHLRGPMLCRLYRCPSDTKVTREIIVPTYFIIFLCKLIQKIKRGKENAYFASMRIESLDYGRLWYVCHKFVQYIYANPKAMCMCFFGGVCTFNWCHLRISCGRRTERDRESWIVNHTLDMFMHLRWINFDL